MPRLVAGIDCAFVSGGNGIIAGAVVWDRFRGAVTETRLVSRKCTFPYIPGLLSFRELPAVIAVLRKLTSEPGVVLCDAQGIAHPRGFGLAAHLGLWIDVPTIGCAKSRLCGEFAPPGPRRGDSSALMLRDKMVGMVLRTRVGVRPLFVSPGNRCDIDSALAVTLNCLTKYRLPEPTRRAHQLVTAYKARLSESKGSQGMPHARNF